MKRVIFTLIILFTVFSISSCAYVDISTRGFQKQPAKAKMPVCKAKWVYDHRLQQPPRESYASLYDRGSWRRDGGLTTGNSSMVLDLKGDGTVVIWMKMEATSNKFKMFSQPSSILILANSKGELIEDPENYDHSVRMPTFMHRIVMGWGSNKRRKTPYRVRQYGPSCDVAYVFMKFRFCSYQQSFGRNNIGSNCGNAYGGPGGTMLRSMSLKDVKDVQATLNQRSYKVGETVRLLEAWQVVRIK